MSQDVKLPKSIKRITVVSADGASPPLEVYAAKSDKKKQSRGLRGLEKWVRKNAGSTKTFGDVYLARHTRSNQKKRDGWLRDLAHNVFKANQKAAKKLQLVKLLRG